MDLAAVAIDGRCEGYSGADCAALVREAAVLALKEAMRAGPGECWFHGCACGLCLFQELCKLLGAGLRRPALPAC